MADWGSGFSSPKDKEPRWGDETMWSTRVAWGLLFWCLALSPTIAIAQDHVVCVSPGATGSDSCVSQPCDDQVANATAAITSAENYVASNGPGQVNICLNEMPITAEVLLVDNAQDRLGSPLVMNFVENQICPGSGDSPGQPAITWTPGTLDFLEGVNIDFRSGVGCGSDPRPGIEIVGDGSLVLTGTLRGTAEFAVRSGTNAQNGRTEIRSTSITECTGAAVIATRRTQIYKTQIIGCESTTTGIIENSGPDGMEFRNSLMVANRAGGGAPGILSGSFNALENVAFVANLVETGVPILDLEPFLPRWMLVGSALQQRSGNAVAHSIFSRNAAVSSLSALPFPSPPQVSRPQDDANEQTCSDAGYENWIATLDLSAADGASPLISYRNGAQGSLATVFRSSFVGNMMGGEPLVEVAETLTGLSLQMLQNSAADNGLSPLLRATALNAGDEVLLARNYVEGGPGLELESNGPLDFMLISHNSGGDSSTWTPVGISAARELVGPALASPEWRTVNEVSGQSACQQHLMSCPGQDTGDCQFFAARGALHCAVDRAAELIPVSQPTLSETDAWPWETDFFGASSSDWVSPGHSGWRCADIRPTVDAVPGLGFGDSDGYPDLVDCDNSDAGSIATVPTRGGEWCVPAGDDDDSTTDDDDSTTDDDMVGDDDDSAQGVPVGCSGKGCGVTFAPSGLAMLLLLGPLRRRRFTQ